MKTVAKSVEDGFVYFIVTQDEQKQHGRKMVPQREYQNS